MDEWLVPSYQSKYRSGDCQNALRHLKSFMHQWQFLGKSREYETVAVTEILEKEYIPILSVLIAAESTSVRRSTNLPTDICFNQGN